MPDLTLSSFESIALVVVMAMAGGFVRGFSGFGGPAVMTLVLTIFFNPLSVLTKVIIIDMISNLKMLPNTFRDVQWRMCLTVSAASVIGVFVGIRILVAVDPAAMSDVIAAVVAACTVAMLTGWRYKREPSTLVQVLAGFAAGVAMGATYIALVAMLFFFAGPATAARARASAVYWAMITGVAVLGSHIAVGSLDVENLWRTLLVAVVYLGGAVLGSRVFAVTAERDFRRFVIWLLAFLAAAGLLL